MRQIPREPGELEYKLAVQRRALDASARSFDAGELWEAERLAVTAYVLLHDGGSNVSLLTQLGLRASIEFVSSSRGLYGEFMGFTDQPIPSKPLSPPTPLLAINLDSARLGFVPLCQVPKSETLPQRRLTFRYWYSETIFMTAAGRKLSRMNLIHSLRNQDGGGHIDSLLKDEAYAIMRVDTDPRLRLNGRPLPNAHYASMRQIAWELEESLRTLDQAFKV